MKVNLTGRLLKIYEMVTGTVCADIGTDHALLPCCLIQSGKVSFCYACDIAEGPLESARKNIEACGLSDRIETVLADGIPDVCAGKCDTIIIAGMGGLMIKDILERRTDIPDGVKLLLQPMTKQSELRSFLVSEGFVIEYEKTVTDAGRTYTVMECGKGTETKPYSPAETEAGRHILGRMNEDDIKYVRQRLRSVRKKLKGARIENNISLVKRLEEAEAGIEKVLKEISDDISGTC